MPIHVNDRQLEPGMKIVSLSGRIDTEAAEADYPVVRQAIEASSAGIIVDLKDVEFISSSGFRLLLMAYRDAQGAGKAMLLTSAVALARGGELDWRHVESATLHVRALSDQFIHSYLDAEWPDVGYTVGVFRLEGRGVQLFERIEGDHFTILGMPLIPLLGALRERGLARCSSCQGPFRRRICCRASISRSPPIRNLNSPVRTSRRP